MKTLLTFTFTLAGAVCAHAQAPTEFPADAAPITAESFAEKMAGKVYKGTTFSNAGWRLDIRKDGVIYWNSDGPADSGKWRVENDQFCAEMRRSTSTCNQVRTKDKTIYYKRVSNGEVVTLTSE